LRPELGEEQSYTEFIKTGFPGASGRFFSKFERE
jgi:hypothetical protein